MNDPEVAEEKGIGLFMDPAEVTVGRRVHWLSKVFEISQTGCILSYRMISNVIHKSRLYCGGVKNFLANPREHSLVVAQSLNLQENGSKLLSYITDCRRRMGEGAKTRSLSFY